MGAERAASSPLVRGNPDVGRQGFPDRITRSLRPMLRPFGAETELPESPRGRMRPGGAMKLERPLRAGEDDILRALISIIAITRRHWRLPDRRPAPEAASGAGAGYETLIAEAQQLVSPRSDAERI